MASLNGKNISIFGVQGLQGPPGQTPYIGGNGNWWVGDTDTGVAANGPTDFDMVDMAEYTTTGKRMSTIGVETDNETVNYIKVPCEEGDIYKIIYTNRRAASGPFTCSWVADENNVLLYVVINDYSVTPDHEIEFTIPKNGAYIYIHYVNTYAAPSLKKMNFQRVDGITGPINKTIEEKEFLRFYVKYGENFYFEENRSNNTLFIKSGDLRVHGYVGGIWHNANYTMEQLATECGLSLTTSVDGVDGCINITDQWVLYYDMKIKKFQCKHREKINADRNPKIPVVMCENSKMLYCHPSLLVYAKGSDFTVPHYWKSAVKTAEGKIEQYQNIGGKDAFTFGFVTDTHVGASRSDTLAVIMERVMNTCDIPLFIHGGDIVGTGSNPKDTLLAELSRQKSIFKKIDDRGLYALGNHDTTYTTYLSLDSGLTDGETYNYIFRNNERKNIVCGATGRYFYKDNPAQKARYIVLDCFDFEPIFSGDGGVIAENNKSTNRRFSEAQLKWLAYIALNVPDDYSVIICSHVPPYREADKNAIGWTSEKIILDSEVALGIVNAYRNKTTYAYNGTIGENTMAETYAINVDFTQYKGDVVCWVAGHTHKDYIFDLDGLKVVSTADCAEVTNSAATTFAPARKAGTNTEYIFDFLCVNKATRTCNIVRLGAELSSNAAGRSFTY